MSYIVLQELKSKDNKAEFVLKKHKLNQLQEGNCTAVETGLDYTWVDMLCKLELLGLCQAQLPPGNYYGRIL